MKKQITECPYCRHILEVDIDWAIRNERVFCNTCCKSFPIRVGEDTEDEPEESKQEQKEEVKEPTIEDKFDEGVKEILKDQVEEDINADGCYPWYWV